MTEHKSIAVDGPSGAGKSTLMKLLAKELGFWPRSWAFCT